ncbi:hypothetical protein MHBO_001131 [Bonamia ostreae]|uniref:Rad60/SUMO-like domain-containing protein n=1 Tax=Bonamia ostreae TaxID=126728 RepID=A0ABV2AI36_9EUKA
MRSQDEAFALAANQDAERERGFESVSQERDKEDGIEVRVRFPDGSTFNFVAYSAQKVAFIYSKVADEIKKKNLPFKKFKLIDSNGMKQLDDKNALISVSFKTRNVFMLVKAA